MPSHNGPEPPELPPDANQSGEGEIIDIQPHEAPELPPASFFALFQYTTRTELLLDVIGLVAAAIVGAAQPVLSLVFSRLANTFVGFGVAASAVKGGSPSAEQLQAFRVARQHFRSQAATDSLYLVYIGIGAFCLSYLYMVIWIWTGERNSRRIREKYFKAVLRQDIAFFDQLGAGAVATRIQSDTHLIQTGMSEKVALVVQYTSSFFSGFIIAYIRSWRLALAMTSIVPGVILTGALMGKFVSKYRNSSLKHIADGGSFAEEVISTIRTAKAFGTQRRLSDVYTSFMTKSYHLDLKSATIQAGAFAFFFFIIYASYALAFSFGTTLVLQGHGNVGVILNVLMAILYGSLSIIFLGPELQALNTARGAAAKIFETIDRVPSIDSESNDGLRLDKITGTITLEDVHLAYSSRPDVPVLRGVSLSFAAGQTSALVGASGSGKSTIVSLIERFYDPTQGIMRFDGVDIRDLNVKWLRSQIGLVGQEPILFSTSIRKNVAYGLCGTPYENVSDEEQFRLIQSACIKANADGFISKLSNGYDTQVGERGFLLSGGQKQRISIARAIVGDPAILVLDEATSALDTRSEGIVQDALNKASQGRTTIVVAHRLSTIKDAHCIYVMGEGEVIEYGSHQDLLRKPNGVYAELVGGQMLREDQEDIKAPGDKVDAASISDLLEGSKEFTVEPTSEPKILPTDDDPPVTTLDKHVNADASEKHKYSAVALFRRMMTINNDVNDVYILGAGAGIVMGMGFPILGIIYGLAIEGFQTTDRHQLRHNGDRNALWFFIVAIVQSFASWAQNTMFQNAASTLTWKLRQMLFQSIIRQDVAWFDADQHSTGSLVSSLADSPLKVFGLAGITLGSIFSSFTTLFGGWIIALIYCWKLALVGMCTSPFLFSMGYARLRVVGLKDERNKKEHAASAQIACEVAASIKTVASLTREEAFYQEYSQSLEMPLRRSNHTSLWSSALFALVQSFLYFSIALVFWYGSRLVSDLEFSTRQFFTCMMCITFGSMQAGNAFNFVPDISSAKGAAEDMVALMDSKPQIDSESPALPSVRLTSSPSDIEKAQSKAQIGMEDADSRIDTAGRVELRDVHFRYPTRPDVPVLRGINMVIEPSSYVAIVGPSGSGKSTIIQLLERFYDPEIGHVLLDGKNVPELQFQDYREQLALVSQEPTLYAGTIRFNIELDATESRSRKETGGLVTQDEIERACRDANIYDFIVSLPEGFDTPVGGKGSQLSGGQKQRIAIARALVRDPRVLLLDEATSALDSTSEKVVQQALDRAAKGRTTISIAHRLSTIQNADRIYYIKDGRVAEAGTHDELLRLRGGYYELVKLQALNSDQSGP